MEWRPNERTAETVMTSVNPQTNADNPQTSEAYQVPGVKHKSVYRVLSQTVVISEISIPRRTFRVHTEIVVIPQLNRLSSIQLHLGHCALLPNESREEDGKVLVNDIPARYRRRDPFTNASSSSHLRCLGDFGPKLYNQLKEKDYNLEIFFPEEVLPKINSRSAFRVSIDVIVKDPYKGVQFVDVPRGVGRDRASHLYTYHSPYLSGTREWLPCLDETDQLLIWQLEIVCEDNMIAAASAELKLVTYSPELKQRTFLFTQTVPTSACNMGWIIGYFTPDHHPESSTLLTFSLPKLSSFVKYTTSLLDKMVEFLEELLSCRFPHSTMKIAFVDQAPEEVITYSGMLICSTRMLYHKRIIDVVQEVRQELIYGLAQQFFGCFIVPSHWVHWWLVKSIARLLTHLYVEKLFGTAESRYQMKKMMNEVCDYEYQWGKIILTPELTDPQRKNVDCDPRHELTCSPLYVQAMLKKGFLIMRMLFCRLGKEPFLQVLHRLLTVGQQMSEKRNTPGAWKHMLTCTEAFFRSVSNVTGSEIPTFVEQWIRSGGHGAFQVTFEFNRKRNMIELEVKQDIDQGNGRLQYVGPLVVVVQELDGAFTHTVQIDGATSHADLQCHSKGRRQKKKRVPLLSGEEVEIDLSNLDPDSPVLWIRVDHDHHLLRDMVINQPIYHWEYMLKYERDVIAQMEALDRLQKFPSAQSKAVIIETVANDNFFYRVRCRAAFALSVVLNRKLEAWTGGSPVLINMFREQYGSKASPNIPRSNNYVVTSQNLQQYFVMQALPQAVSRLRKQSGEPLEEVVSFLMDLIKFNDNSTNRYSDDHYRASLYMALATSIAPCETLPLHIQLPENLSAEIRSIIQEFTYALNMDTMSPSFGRIVGISALTGLYHLQKNGYLPLDSKILWTFAQPKVCPQIRTAAITLLVDRVCNDQFASECRHEDVLQLLEFACVDRDPSIRALIVRLISITTPFATFNNTVYGFNNACNTIQYAEKLWSIVSNPKIDAVVRLGCVDIFFSQFGLGVPPVMGGPSEAPGHHRSYSSVVSPVQQLPLSQWHNSAYEFGRSSPTRGTHITSFGDDTLK
ncbi:unnamed protein product [Caenorhabditis auriculariae]|uniref:Transcription initiation factor TFIID subunit 2 n=1 Tax=Caenorhabditis auriculariae TaxID=2777116 RepID=A0A8S1HD40_9PELO|nr:unnamed protein product [Caenorhabditis auriculariae]